MPQDRRATREMRNRVYRFAGAFVVATALSCATSALLAQAPAQSPPVTPWQVGDVFVGVGNPRSSPGTYKTLDATGQPKLDASGSPVPDLNTGTKWATNCLVDRTAPQGDLWTESWEDMALSHFSGSDHSLVASYSFNVATPIPVTQP